MKILRIIALGLSLTLTDNLLAQTTQDSTTIHEIATGFFDWYLAAAKEKRNSEAYPLFVESKDGKATLDYSKYIERLRENSFSNRLIEEEIESYQECKRNLEKISYQEFKETWKDLDDFEATKCDFTNYYRWIGGQELWCNKFVVESIKIKDDTTIVRGFLIDENSPITKENGEPKTISFIRNNKEWLIDRIK